MDEMDIDHTVDVPDTPDRLPVQRVNGRNGCKEEKHNHSRKHNLSKEGSEDHPVVIGSGSGGLSLRPPKCAGSFNNARHLTGTGASSLTSSSSSRNGHLFRKGVTEKKHPSHDVRPSSISKSSCHGDEFVDLTERNVHRRVNGNGSPSKMAGNDPAEFRKRSGLANGASSSSSFLGRKIFPSASGAKEETKKVSGDGSSVDFREGVDFVGNIKKNPGNSGFISLDTSPRVNRQKRLVRNGCISPNNIAKAKQVAGKDSNGSLAVAHNNNNNDSKPSSAAPISVDIRELVAEDSDSYTRKGKGVMIHPSSSKEPDFRNKNLHSRSSINVSEKVIGTTDYNRGAGKGIEESSGWISTRNGSRETNISLPDEEMHRGRGPLRYSSQHHENRVERNEKGVSVANADDKGVKLVSSEHVGPQPLKESVSHHRARVGRLNGSRSKANTLIKRQKQGSTSSSGGECSTSVPDDPNIVNLEHIIEVDDVSPQLRCDARDEDVRARQVEADERLARELQEQLYNEAPAFGAGEVDMHMALALQHQDNSNRGFARARHLTLEPRASMSNLHRQSQPGSSSNVPRRGHLSRSAALGRMTRSRGRFPGQSRTLSSSRGRTSMFPDDMDVEMRMHILGALEEFSDMGLSAGILQAPRDFNDGASVRQINGLPETRVESENFEETCAICLDTPTIGDTIRHLPCLHKFHKDCIDPWLRRRTSCPVCKSSVT